MFGHICDAKEGLEVWSDQSNQPKFCTFQLRGQWNNILTSIRSRAKKGKAIFNASNPKKPKIIHSSNKIC